MLVGTLKDKKRLTSEPMAPPCENLNMQTAECFAPFSPVLNEIPSSDAADSETKMLDESSTKYDENLWTIHGVEYDLSSFVDKHPGGKSAILLGKGRDCSALFESYHPFTDVHRQVLKRYTCEKADGSGGTRRKIPSQKDVDPFYHEMCNRVRGEFESNGIDVSRAGKLKATKFRIAHYIVCGIAGLCCYMVYINAYRIGPVLFAFSCWIQGSLGHDASHFSVSRKNWANRLGTYLGMGLLSSPFLWMYQHTYAHHSYTNVYEKDPDLHHFFFLRVCPEKRWARKYVLQANVIYVWLWWSIITFAEAVWLPFRVIMSGRLDSALEGVEGRAWALRPFVSLATHIFLYLLIVTIIPLCWGNEAFTWKYIIFYWLFSGITFGVFTQVSHLCKGSFQDTESLRHKKKGSKSITWAENQVLTSNNYGLYSWLWFQLSLGLNYQIEHHLFPGCNSEYLPLIAPTVREVCEEYGVKYKSFDNLSCIFNAVMENLVFLSHDK